MKFQHYVLAMYVISAIAGLALVGTRADASTTHLDCRYRVVGAPRDQGELSHHVQLRSQETELFSVTGPFPTCEQSGTSFEIFEDRVVWECTEENDNGQIIWVGAINRYTLSYVLQATNVQNEARREFLMRGSCVVVERQF